MTYLEGYEPATVDEAVAYLRYALVAVNEAADRIASAKAATKAAEEFDFECRGLYHRARGRLERMLIAGEVKSA